MVRTAVVVNNPILSAYFSLNLILLHVTLGNNTIKNHLNNTARLKLVLKE
jgi:hypothetical protein